MGFLASPAGVGPPIRDIRRDRIQDARGEADRCYRAVQERLHEDREWRRREEDYRRRLDDEPRWREAQR